ncbi:MAG: nucleotidyltransferase domain-containing protein [Planctomycetota bacterium]
MASTILQHTLAPAEQRVVTAFARRLREHFGDRLARVVLFGSRARGDVTEESDIDLLVLLRIPIVEETRWTRDVWEIVQEVLRREPRVYIPLTPIVLAEERFLDLKRLERSFALDVEAEGIPL